MTKADIYQECPVFETESFLLRLIKEGDAEDLLKCYSCPEAVRFINSDNCINNFYYQTLDEMKNAITFWLKSYDNKEFVRFSVIDRQKKAAVGTIEMFGRSESDKTVHKIGILRIDLLPEYEKQHYISEILKLSNERFYSAFRTEHIISKAIPEATERRAALEENGFCRLPGKAVTAFDDYYIDNRIILFEKL